MNFSLVYHFFLHDAQASIALNINPLISYAELQLPLPARRQLWEASTADEWKRVYFPCTAAAGPDPDRLPSLSDTLRDMSQLANFQGWIDSQLAGLLSLHGISALITEYHRIKSISRGSSRHWNALIIQSRQQELSQALQHFRMLCSEWAAPDILLIQEMMAMLLHMSLEDLQLFAGKEDKKSARRAYCDALEWIKSTDSRRAVWHAGQAVRVVSENHNRRLLLSGFYAIVIYYASLAFWSYGVISSQAKSDLTGMRTSPNVLHEACAEGSAPPTVSLNESETIDVQMFIEFGRGSPALKTAEGTAAFLDDPSATTGFVREVLQSNYQSEKDAGLPQLVQSLCQLMQDLGNAAEKTRMRTRTIE